MRSTGQVVRAVLVVVALVAAVVVIKVAPDPDRGVAIPPEPVAASPRTGVAPEEEQAASPSSGEASEEVRWERVARSFISRYDNTKGGRAAWLRRLRPVVSQDVYSGLQTVRLANLPSGTFAAGEVLWTAEVGGTMRFPLRGGPVRGLDVTVSVADEGTLRVTGFVPVREQQVA